MSFFEQRISEPKPSKCGTLTVRTVKVGNKVMGTIEAPKLKPGTKMEATYWMSERVARLVGGGRHVSVDRTMLGGLSTYGVRKIGLRLADGSTYVAPINSVTDTHGERTARFVCVPASEWEVVLPPEEVRVANTLGKMRVAGGRSQSSVTAVS